MLLNPMHEKFASLDERSMKIMKATIEFFESKGKARLKEDDRERRWYRDFLDLNQSQRIFSTLLTPPEHAIDDPDARWDTHRNCVLNEILGFYGLPYWYAWQVSILGLGPIWMSGSMPVKQRAARMLRDGGIFGFALSEKAHGADLYATDMMLTPMTDGTYRADGGKYYIGNGNEAALLSVFGRSSEDEELVFFAVDPKREGYECVRNVVSSQMYVSELALRGYEVKADELLAHGSEAWDAALNTVNIGKFNLGWASIGMCTHALYESVAHAAKRRLYNTRVTDFPHIRRLLVDAFTRLVAMRLFATRAIDYMRSASLDDRRYLLYNPLVKMKVTTQGEEVINLLWDVIAAKGFEKDTYFEMAARDIRALPKLEGTVHVNMALVIKFMASCLLQPTQMPEVPARLDPAHDAFLFAQGPARGLGSIRFHDPQLAYSQIDLPNAQVFTEQIVGLKQLLLKAPPDKAQSRDMDLLLSLGEIFSLIVYGQLILEAARLQPVPEAVLDQILHVMVRDLSRHALDLSAAAGVTAEQAELSVKMIRRPVHDPAHFETVFSEHVAVLEDAYTMAP